MENIVGHQNPHDFAPIQISLPSAPGRTVIRSVEEAAKALLTRWPDDDGEWFYEAVKACLDCLHGNVEPHTARHAVLCAAREAGFEIQNEAWELD